MFAASGNGNYVLSLGQPSAATADASAGGALQSAAEFVPGEVIVRWRQRPASALRAGSSRRGANTVMAAHALSKVAGELLPGYDFISNIASAGVA